MASEPSIAAHGKTAHFNSGEISKETWWNHLNYQMKPLTSCKILTNYMERGQMEHHPVLEPERPG